MLIKHRKGQSAVEYLANNAWVVAVAIIGILVLWQMGVFTPPQPKRGSMGFSQITPSDWVVSEKDIAYVRMTNEAGTDVEIPKGGMTLDVYQIACDTQPTPNTDVVMKPGSSKIFVFYCDGTPKISNNYRTGDYYEGDIEVEYINKQSGAEHKSVGKIFGPIEGQSKFGTGTTIPTLPNCEQPCTQPGILNAIDCTRFNNTNCSYCDLYKYECTIPGSCGKPCTMEKTMEECDQTCQYCNPESGRCEQGDCGKTCTINEECVHGCEQCTDGVCKNPEQPKCPTCSEIYGGRMDTLECQNAECPFCYNYNLECREPGDCELPCLNDNDCQTTCPYCNPNTDKCEQGDCDKPCNEDEDCTLGCEKCIAGKCAPEETSTTTSAPTTARSSTTTTTSTTIPGDHYIIVGQVYPENGSAAYTAS